jgi:hypothetical protein
MNLKFKPSCFIVGKAKAKAVVGNNSSNNCSYNSSNNSSSSSNPALVSAVAQHRTPLSSRQRPSRS